jgi:sugar lactone lactonase YvrE
VNTKFKESIAAPATKSLFDMSKSYYLNWRLSSLPGVACWLLMAGLCHAQLSSTAYRVLGQPDLHLNGLNMVTGQGLNSPIGVALDARGGQVHIYIADTQNSRILGWPDMNSYQTGDPPALVLAQPNPQYSSPLGIGPKGLTNPLGVAVDPTTGNLYVADFGDNRVVRFPSPFANPARIEPDAVYGQASFSGATAGLSATAMSGPRAVACDAAGNLWVADSGNNRILRFAAATLNSPAPVSADTVIGQADFLNGAANGGSTISASGLSAPVGLAFDAQGNLYVADFGNVRVLRFPAPLGPSNPNAAATGVWGQPHFATRGSGQAASATSIGAPLGIAVDNSGNLYVAIPSDNRMLVFPTSTPIGATATSVYGQSSFTSTTANAGVAPLSSGNSLSGPADVKIDPSGNVLVADAGNNRVLQFPSSSKTATRVWGQTDFTSNGPNRIKPGSINSAFKMAIDYSAAPFALYVSDTANNRVLIWKDSVHFRNGDPADLVIGQPSLLTNGANLGSPNSQSPTATSLSGPAGLAVNPGDGTLYVADFHNNRVLRFPRPVAQTGQITPDAVIGQVDFTSSTSAAVNASSLSNPAGLAIGPNGDLFVADSGNNRVLEFPAPAPFACTGNRICSPRLNPARSRRRLSAHHKESWWTGLQTFTWRTPARTACLRSRTQRWLPRRERSRRS